MKKIVLKSKLILLLSLSSSVTTYGQQLMQLGTTIGGEQQDDYFGRSVSLDEEGNTVVIGSANNQAQTGYVKVMDWDGSAWTQRGINIAGESSGGIFGSCTSISDDGNIVAIGAPYNTSPNGSYSGHVRVYQWDGTEWIKLGPDIDGFSEYDQFGTSICLNSSGRTIAVGAVNDNENFEGSGQATVYDWDGSTWVQRGAGILGVTTGDGVGSAVSLSSDGNTLAVGAANAGPNWSFAGKTMIYDWDGTSWVQRGNDILGEYPQDNAGCSVDLNEEGNSVVIGALKNNQYAGHARIYDWNGTAWVQRGADIDGDNQGDWSGNSVAISADGNTVVIGSRSNGEMGENAGKVRVFDWNGTAWVKRMDDISGDTVEDYFGYSVSCSANGKIIACGSLMDDVGFTESGSTSVYSYCIVNPYTTVQGTTITSFSGSGTYQWLNCDTDQIITGETEQSFTASENGNYAVIVTESGCSDTSECVEIISVGLNENSTLQFSVFPNPTNQKIVIQLNKKQNFIDIIIHDMLGQIVFKENHTNVDQIELHLNLPDGMYDVQINNSNGSISHHKIIKKS